MPAFQNRWMPVATIASSPSVTERWRGLVVIDGQDRHEAQTAGRRVLSEDLVADPDRFDCPGSVEGPDGGAGPEAGVMYRGDGLSMRVV